MLRIRNFCPDPIRNRNKHLDPDSNPDPKPDSNPDPNKSEKKEPGIQAKMMKVISALWNRNYFYVPVRVPVPTFEKLWFRFRLLKSYGLGGFIRLYIYMSPTAEC